MIITNLQLDRTIKEKIDGIISAEFGPVFIDGGSTLIYGILENQDRFLPSRCHSHQECNKYICRMFVSFNISEVAIKKLLPAIDSCDQNYDASVSRFLAYASNESIDYYNECNLSLNSKLPMIFGIFMVGFFGMIIMVAAIDDVNQRMWWIKFITILSVASSIITTGFLTVNSVKNLRLFSSALSFDQLSDIEIFCSFIATTSSLQTTLVVGVILIYAGKFFNNSN
jgi:hypothetical protein